MVQTAHTVGSEELAVVAFAGLDVETAISLEGLPQAWEDMLTSGSAGVS